MLSMLLTSSVCWWVGVSAPSSFLLVSERELISRLATTSSDAGATGALSSLDVALPVGLLHNVRALAYDVNTHFIYWIDGRTKSIRRARDDGSHVCRLPLTVPLFTVGCSGLIL